MWNTTEPGRQLVSELTKELVAEMAPDELSYADELLAEYYAHPPQAAHQTDDPLGFGGEVIAMATPVIAMAVNAVVVFIVSEVIKSVKDESAELIKKKVQALFGSKAKKPETALSKETLTRLLGITTTELRRGGMGQRQAEEAALKIVARLFLGV